MLTAGTPGSGAGYVATELFRRSAALGHARPPQLGTMAGSPPPCVIVPGSGTAELAGTTGALEIGEIHDDGRHEVRLTLG